MGQNETKETPLKIIKTLAKDLIEQMTTKTQELRTQLSKSRDYYTTIERERIEKVELLTKRIEEAKRKNELLLERRGDLQEKINRDVDELNGLEKENSELGRQINELKIINKNLVERKEALGNKLTGISGKHAAMRNKEMIRAKDQAIINQNYKTFFGINILRNGGNSVKIVFSHTGGGESYVVFDFNQKNSITEVSGGLSGTGSFNGAGSLSVEKLNLVFQEMKSFCKFIKYLRGEFMK